MAACAASAQSASPAGAAKPGPAAPAAIRPPGGAEASGTAGAAGPGTSPPSLLALRALLQDARQWLQRKDPGSAYALLEPNTGIYSGSADFNFLLGISALDSGRPSQAVLALERVLAHDPDNTLARAEIGRAYLALRETAAAKREFEEVARAKLAPEVQDTVSRYLQIITQIEAAPARRWSAMVETQVGYDSNVNFGSSLDRWVLDDGQALTPLPSSRPQRSAFLDVSGQFQYTGPINGKTEWTVGSQLSQRINGSQHNSDLGSVEASGGLARTEGRDRYSLGIQLQQLYLDDRSFRQAAGLSAQWQRDVDSRTQVGLYGQLFNLKFPKQAVRDARRSVFGATGVRGVGDKKRTVLIGNAYAGRESSRHDIGELSFDLYGLRAVASRNLTGNWRASAGISHERRSHKDADAFFGVTRKDRQSEIRIGAERAFGTRLAIGPQLVFTRNSSTLAPTDFRRMQAVVAARYRF